LHSVRLSVRSNHSSKAAGSGEGEARHCAGCGIWREFGNSASGKLAFALQNGFGGFVN